MFIKKKSCEPEKQKKKNERKIISLCHDITSRTLSKREKKKEGRIIFRCVAFSDNVSFPSTIASEEATTCRAEA